MPQPSRRFSRSQLQQSSKLGLGLIFALCAHWLVLQAMPRLADKLPTTFHDSPPLTLSLHEPKPVPPPSVESTQPQAQTPPTSQEPPATEIVNPPPTAAPITKPISQPATTAKKPTPKPKPKPRPKTRPKVQTQQRSLQHPKPQPKPQPTAAELMANSLAMANSADDLWDLNTNSSTTKLRHKTITPSTQEPEYRSYLTAWVHKVETIGQRNYPTYKKQQLKGKLTLDVAIDAHGHTQDIEITNSSGDPRLDQAAIDIVKLGSPYAPLPANILEHTDILHIRRQWVFASGAAQF